MKNDNKLQKAFDFLVQHGKSGKPFKLEELIKTSGWTQGTAKIYLSKKSSDLVEKRNGIYHGVTALKRGQAVQC